MSAQDIVPSCETAADISSVIRARQAAKRQQIMLRRVAGADRGRNQRPRVPGVHAISFLAGIGCGGGTRVTPRA